LPNRVNFASALKELVVCGSLCLGLPFSSELFPTLRTVKLLFVLHENNVLQEAGCCLNEKCLYREAVPLTVDP